MRPSYPTLQAALALLDRHPGWHLFPVSPSKRPLAGSQGPLDATCRPDQLIALWHQAHQVEGDFRRAQGWSLDYPDFNLALAPRGCVLVVDIDSYKPPDEAPAAAALLALAQQHGGLPRTLTVLSPSGGRHLYFAPPSDWTPSTTMSNGIRGIGQGVDWRLASGFALLPPSQHATGKRYGFEDLTIPIAPAPPFLLTFCEGRTQRKRAGGPSPRAVQATDRLRSRVWALVQQQCHTIANLVDGRRAALFGSSRLVGGLLHLSVVSQDEMAAALIAAGVQSGTRHDPTRPVRDGLKAGLDAPWELEERPPPLEPTRPDPGEPPAYLDEGPFGDEVAQPAGQAAPPSRPVIEVTTVLGPMVDQAVDALATHPEVYQRGGELIHVTTDATGQITLRSLKRQSCRELLSRVAQWCRFDPHKAELVACRVPVDVADALLLRATWPAVRPLVAVVAEPILRADGTLLQKPGYDAQSQVLYHRTSPFPAIPERPTQAEASAAAERVLAPFCDFPFRGPADRSAVLAMILTPMAWSAFEGPAPLGLIDANVRGAGKSLLAQAIGTLATGQLPAIRTAVASDEVMDKRVAALLRGRHRVALLDNVTVRLGWPCLDAVLTSNHYAGRILGQTRDFEVVSHTTWLATANNCALGADTTRRVLPIVLESPHEAPEDRPSGQFSHPHLQAWIAQQRPELAAAALTLLRAYVAAGRPPQALPPWGSYEGWSALIRGAVVWAGLPDPCQSRQGIDDRDEGAEELDLLLNGLVEMFGVAESFRSRDLLDRLQMAGPRSAPVLREVVEAWGPRPGALPSARAIGMQLKRHERRWRHNIRITSWRDRTRLTWWKLERR